MDRDFERKFCTNCGRLIEIEEFMRNPYLNDVHLCKHCRLIMFDGSDLYDAKNSFEDYEEMKK